MPSEKRVTSRKSRRWWRLFLLLPLMDIKSSLPGKTGDHQSYEVQRLRERLKVVEKPQGEGSILSGQPDIKPRKKGLIRSVIRWMISPLKR